MSKEVAKELLRKGILLGDPELVEMANQLLGEPEEESLIVTDMTEKPKKSRGRPKKTAIAIDKEEDSFIIKKKSGSSKEVIWSGNTWKDTGENGDLDKKELKTPKIKLEPRRPPYKKVAHKCSRCNNSVKIYPHEKTEFYKCENCINEIVRR